MPIPGRALLAGAFILAAGCTKATPSFSTLDQSSIPQPTFDGQTTKSILITSSTATISVQGQCDKRINSLAASADSLSLTFSSMVSGTATIACAKDGTFSFTLKSLSDLGFNIADNTDYEIHLSGITTGGVSRASTVRLVYSTTGGAGPKRTVLTSGSTESSSGARLATSASFKANIRINHFAASALGNQADSKSSTNYKFKSGAAAASN